MRIGKSIRRAIKHRVRRLLGLSDTQAKRRDGKAALTLPKPPAEPSDFGPARMLSEAPPVFLSGMPRGEYLGIATAFGRRYGNVKAGFVIFPTWSLEYPGRGEAIRERWLRHVARYPNHKFRFICNTRIENMMLEEVGLPTQFLNKNFMVSDRIFHPDKNAEPEFDAVYNARFIPQKRHELAASVPRVAYVAYVQPKSESSQQKFHALYAAALARNPGHALMNEMVDGLPVVMSRERVNAVLGRAAVGLILSRIEGSNYASMEYMLAGLPVVSTPSKGGRDVFFDPEFCIVCKPEPSAVRDAVAALRARNIPRDVIRARTLARIEPERARFLALVDDLIEELGGARRYGGGPWPFGEVSGVPWGDFKEHLAAFGDRLRNNLAEELGLDRDALAGVQLDAAELRPVIGAIRERAGCALLVFGCGRDSRLWEHANRDGITAFLEDNPEWAGAARAALVTASVHTVQYDTKRSDWRKLLEQPSELTMDLPAAIAGRRWDVILVDGPAGFNDDQPGRMKSIHAASRLVAPGGRVFVHDCQRPVEQAFASRYLGDHRLFVEAKGPGAAQRIQFLSWKEVASPTGVEPVSSP